MDGRLKNTSTENENENENLSSFLIFCFGFLICLEHPIGSEQMKHGGEK